MKTFKNILVVSRSTKNCMKVLKTGISLAQKYNAKLHLLHILHDPFGLDGWNLPVPSFEEEYKKMVADTREKLHKMIQSEEAEGIVVNETVEDSTPVDAIKRMVEKEHIDLILMLGHKEGRLEHFLFGKTNDAIIRNLPATLMLIK